MSILFDIFLDYYALVAKLVLIALFWNTIFYMNGGINGSMRQLSLQEAKQYVNEWRREVSSVTAKSISPIELVCYVGCFYSSSDWGSAGDTSYVRYSVNPDDYLKELELIQEYCKIENRKVWNYFDESEKFWWSCVENVTYLGGKKNKGYQFDAWTDNENNEFFVRRCRCP